MAGRRRFVRDFHLGRFDRDLSKEIREEIGFYLEMRTKELIDAGLPPDEAWRQALEAFGDPKEIEKRKIDSQKRISCGNYFGNDTIRKCSHQPP